MHITLLHGECLLHIFSFLDKDGRLSLSRTCRRMRAVFLEPSLWPLLRFDSPSELRKKNFVLGASLRCLSVCWHSSRVQVCNIEGWMKSSLQRSICGKHEKLVSTFLAQVGKKCPHLRSLTLSGCGHITDDDLAHVLQRCAVLRTLRLENCVGITDALLDAIVSYGRGLTTVQVDFCRNVTQEGLQLLEVLRPLIRLSADRSADMIPDREPQGKVLNSGVPQKRSVTTNGGL